MGEKLWNNLLAYLVRTGRLDLRLDNQVVDSILAESESQSMPARAAEIKNRLVIARQDRALKEAARTVKHRSRIAVGRFVEALRETAGLTPEEVAFRLRKDVDYVQRFERGHAPPLRIPVRDFADIVQLFGIKVGDLSPMLSVSSAVAAVKSNFRVAARSHGGKRTDTRAADVEKALDLFARKRMASEQGPSEEVRAFIEKLRGELRQRDCRELLE